MKVTTFNVVGNGVGLHDGIEILIKLSIISNTVFLVTPYNLKLRITIINNLHIAQKLAKNTLHRCGLLTVILVNHQKSEDA